MYGTVERIYRVASFAYDAWIEMSSVMTRPSKRFVASFAYDAWIEIESRIKRAANIIGRIVSVRSVDRNTSSGSAFNPGIVASYAYDAWIEIPHTSNDIDCHDVASFAYDAWIEMALAT